MAENSQVFYDLPVPKEPNKVQAFNDGTRWIQNIIPGSMQIANGYMTCLVNYNRQEVRFTIALETIAGWRELAE